MQFRDISPAEETQFRQWARDNYKKGRYRQSGLAPGRAR